MKKWVLSGFIIFTSLVTTAQNLVPNPGFEDYNACPTIFGGIDFSPGYSSFGTVQAWINPLEFTSPDYFNTCAYPTTPVGLPETFVGYKNAHTGNGAAGIWAYVADPAVDVEDYREYMECRLAQPMQQGHRYDVSFYVSFSYVPSGLDVIAIDRLGANFSDTLVAVSNRFKLSLPCQVVNAPGNYISDTAQWVNITGTYVAHGGEQWMTIGCFDNDSAVGYLQVYPSIPTFPGGGAAYYFIDDVSVTEQPCDSVTAIHDTTICRATDLLLSPGTAATSYVWSTTDTTVSITINTAGIYWRVAVNGCKVTTDTFHVGTPDNVTVVRDTLICNNVNTSLLPATTAANYIWSTGDTTAHIMVSGAGIYWREAYGCNIVTDTFHVSTFPVYDLNIGPDISFCGDDSIMIGTATQPGIRYLWSTGDTGSSIVCKRAGTYILTAIINCETISDTVVATVTPCNNCLSVPTAFSPNNDGLNDNFTIHSRCAIMHYHLSIFDRWGQLVFATNTITEGWNGAYQGVPMPVGTYNYYVEYSIADLPNDKKLVKGDVTLLK